MPIPSRKDAEELCNAYSNMASEIKVRLDMVEQALAWDWHLPDGLDRVARSDFCVLQCRKIFEAIALGCLLAHGDAVETTRLNDIYRADKLLKALEKLHPDFYPHPCEFFKLPDGKYRTTIYLDGDWLTKERLIELYRKLDRELHVGSITRRRFKPRPITVDSFRTIVSLTNALLRQHAINLKGEEVRLIVNMNAPNNLPICHLVRTSD